MTYPTLRGTFTALVTPFTADNAIDSASLKALVDEQLAGGVAGLLIFGTTGESPTIKGREYEEALRFVVEQVAGRAIVIGGTGTNDTEKTLAAARLAKDAGVDALLVVAPYYNKPTQEGLYRHFWSLAEAVDIPQVVYNIAGRTAVNIETDTLVRLGEHPRIVGVKEASADLEQIMDVIAQTPENFYVLSGTDQLNFSLLTLGGDGVISVISNLLPKQTSDMVNYALRGEVDKARTLHYQLLPLIRGCFLESNPIPIKTALALQGKLQEVFRLPLCPMREETKARWKTLLVEQGLLPTERMRQTF